MSTQPIERTLPISDSELRDLLLEYRRENWKGIQPPDVQERIVEDLIKGDAEDPLRQVAPFIDLSRASRILDLGSGVGSFVVACRNRGLAAFGVEPDRIGQGAKLNAIQIARRRLSSPVFASAVGESLPFPDACFDLVVMNQVVEHVYDQQQVILEAARVVREGGVVYAACPNYLRFYEPHYKIFWLPLMPKSLGRWYLRLRGRSPAMLNQLTYTTNRRLKRLLSAVGPGYTVLDIHREQFLRKRASNSFAAGSTRLVCRLTNLPLIGRIVLWGVLRYASIAEGGCAMVLIRRQKGTAEC
ncbi:MAG: methyltransferase domain-containing protein [Acidobacteriia bacterium]|nr:methyltransferase domain-containing protein [Terriglobia bacterium]